MMQYICNCYLSFQLHCCNLDFMLHHTDLTGKCWICIWIQMEGRDMQEGCCWTSYADEIELVYQLKVAADHWIDPTVGNGM